MLVVAVLVEPELVAAVFEDEAVGKIVALGLVAAPS